MEDAILGGFDVIGALDFREGSSPRVESCKVSGNVGAISPWGDGNHHGGGVYCSDSAPRFTDCDFIENGPLALRIEGDSALVLETCTVAGTRVEVSDESSLAMTDTRILSNGVGGVHCEDSTSVSMTGCLVAGGSVGGSGASVDINHSTIVDSDGVGVSLWGSGALRVRNSIIWGHSLGALHADEGATLEVEYSCMDQEAPQGAGNLQADPRFCRGEFDVSDQEELEVAAWTVLSLSARSPCLGSAEGGADMGADLGIRESPGEEGTLIRLGPGRYDLAALHLLAGVHLEGAGEDRTVIERGFLPLGPGTAMERLTADVEGLGTPAGGRCELSECTILGEVLCVGSSPHLERCTISSAHIGVHCFDGAEPTLRGCVIHGNGGGLVCLASSPTLYACEFTGNGNAIGMYDGSGGRPEGCTISGNAVGFYGGSFTVFTNCLFSGNASAVYCDGVAPTFTNCTLSGNGAGFYFQGPSTPTVTNCIAWGNRDYSLLVTNAQPTVSFSTIEGAEPWPGVENSNLDPEFERPGVFDLERLTEDRYPDFIIEPGDYHLRTGSPAIDTGTLDGAPATDLEERPRPCGDAVDRGAFESGDCVGSVRFLRGDCNDDGTVDISDAIFTLGSLFLGEGDPACDDACDSNDDGAVDISDAINTLGVLFLGNSLIPLPGMKDCGLDPTDDEVGCDAFNRCP